MTIYYNMYFHNTQKGITGLGGFCVNGIFFSMRNQFTSGDRVCCEPNSVSAGLGAEKARNVGMHPHRTRERRSVFMRTVCIFYYEITELINREIICEKYFLFFL